MSAGLLETSATSTTRKSHEPAAPLVGVLSQLYSVIESVSDAQYTQSPMGVITSSIGAHVRHCLDHVRELLQLSLTDELDYDRRNRGTEIETSRISAMGAICELQRRLIELPPDVVEQSVSVSIMMTSDGAPVTVQSSVGREIAFVLSHTIHHNALIGVMVKTLGGSLPDRFGYAPATVAFQERRCARSA